MGTENRTGIGGRGAGLRKTTVQLVIFYITNNGHTLAQRIQAFYPDARIMKFTSARAMHELPLLWDTCRNFIFIMATGIVIRKVAPLLKDKRTDPAVVVLDENGRFVISLVSGHIGGANALASEIADHLGAQAVITTASDIQGKVSLDLWALEKDLYVEDMVKLKEVSTAIVNDRSVTIFSETAMRPEDVPDEFSIVDSPGEADIIISSELMELNAFFLRPRSLVAGIGCNRGTQKEEIESVIAEIFHENRLSPHSIRSLASIDVKRDEKGLLEYAQDNELNISFFSAEELNRAAEIYKLARSETVMAATGAAAVAEPAAMLGADSLSDQCNLVVPKQKRGNVTLAIAKAEFSL